MSSEDFLTPAETDALLAFFRARLDEDEQAARAASPGPWSANAEHDEVHRDDGVPVAEGFALSGRQLRATVDHIVRHDPDRVMREVQSGRRLIERYENARAAAARPSVSAYVHGQDRGYWEACLDAVRDRAESYDDHEAYQERWRLRVDSDLEV